MNLIGTKVFTTYSQKRCVPFLGEKEVFCMYSFNGKEKDDEWNGTSGGALDFGARIYDSRLGRWMSVDPLKSKYPEWSPYNAFNDNPLIYIDPTGKGGELVLNKDGTATVKMVIVIYKDENSKITDNDLSTMKNKMEGDAANVLNQKDPNTNKPLTMKIDGKDVEVNFEVTVITANSLSEAAVLSDNSNNTPATNFYLITDRLDGGGTTRGGNAGVIDKNASAKLIAHEYLHLLGYKNPKPDDKNDGTHSDNPQSLSHSSSGSLLQEDMDKFTKVTYNKKTYLSGKRTNNIYNNSTSLDKFIDEYPSGGDPVPINKN